MTAAVTGQRTVNRPALLIQPEVHSQSYQNLALFRVYVAYRSLLSIVLLIMLVNPSTRTLVGSLSPEFIYNGSIGLSGHQHSSSGFSVYTT